jgi:predicted dehydrogenase
MNAAEAEELVAEARERELFLMEAMWARFLPHMVEVRRLLAEGALGELVTVMADHGQWFAEDREFRLFAPELGGGALLDLGIYPVSFASMVLGTPDRVVALADPAFTGVDAQTSILLGHPGGAHAVLTCTLAAKSPTQATIAGAEGRIEVEGPFYAPGAFTLAPREGEPQRFEPPHEGRGMLYEADEVARCIGEGLLESPVIPLDETVAIMRTMDAAQEQAAATA